MDKDYSKYDPESRRQMIIIDLQSAAIKNTKEIEELKKMLWQSGEVYKALASQLHARMAALEKKLIELRNEHGKLTEVVKELGKQNAEKPKEVNLLEVIKSLFKRK